MGAGFFNDPTLIMPSRRWNNLTKVIVVTLLVVVIMLTIFAFRPLISSTILAFFLAFTLGYPVNWIQQRTGWARGPAVMALYALLLLALGLVTLLIIPRISGLVSSLEETIEALIVSLQQVAIPIGDRTFHAGDFFEPLSGALQNIFSVASVDPMSIFRGVTNGILISIYVLVLNFWLLKDLQQLQRFIMEQIPADYQEDVRRLSHEIGQIWEGFLRGQLVLGVVYGVMTWIPLAIVGMANAGGLALLAGVMELLPTVGQGISGTIGVLVALFQGSTWMNVSNVTFTLIVFAIYSVLAQIENIYLVPRLVGGRVKLHPAVAFVVAIGGALAFGTLGVLLATPVVASARTLFVYAYRKLLDQEPFESAGAPSSVRIRGLVGGRKIEAIVFDLDGTLTALDWRMVAGAATHLQWLGWLAPAEQRQRTARRLMVALEGFVNFLISQLHRAESPQLLERLLPFFNLLRGYPAPEKLTLQPQVAFCLANLARHYRVALITARDHRSVCAFLHEQGLDDQLFHATATRNTVRNLLPHSEGLLYLSEQLGLAPEQMLVISDSDVNLRAGRAMGMATAAVLTGLGEEKDMRSADITLQTVCELEEWL